MFKRKDLGKRIAAFALAATMVVTLVPQMDYHASGVPVDGYPVYNDIIYDAVKDKITNSAQTSRDTVYAGIGSWFYWDEENRVGKTHIYHNSTFISSRVNIRPSINVISADSNDWKAVFYPRSMTGITWNPDVSLRFGATFKSTKNKPSMTLDGVTIGGSSLSKKSTQSVEGTATYPFDSNLNVTVQGASGTEVMNMWIAAVDNTSPEETNISAELKYDGVYVHIKMDEDLRWANSEADQYIDDMYINIDLISSSTGIGNVTRKAEFYGLDGRTLTFRCSRESLGDYYEDEFQISNISKFNIPVVSGIDFEVYGVRGCYDYPTGYSYDTRQQVYQKVDNVIAYLQDVKLDTTPITDLAGNKINLSSINLLGKELFIDNKNPKIEEVFVRDSAGASREDAAEMAGKEENSWPEDINRKDLFLGENQGIQMSILISEQLKTENLSPKAKLNVLDENGKQVELPMASITAGAQGTYVENLRTQIVFQTFTAKKGMKMMEGHEGQPIKIIGFSGMIEDKSGNLLDATIPAPDKQIYLDVTPPAITVEKLATTENGRELQFQVTINDKLSNELSAGVLGEYATMKLTATALTELDYNYIVESSDGKQLASGTGKMSGETAGMIRWKLHAHDKYAATVKIQFTNTNKITVDEIQATVSVADIVKNLNTNEKENYPFIVDEVAPVLTIQPETYTSAGNVTSVMVPIQVTDYSEVASIRYQWTENGVTAPDENAWQAFSFTAGKTAQVSASYAFENSSQMKLWVKAGDNKGNFVQISKTFIVEINRPKIYFDDTEIIVEPDEAPVLTVVGPAKKSATATQNANADGYIRVTVTMGTDTYVRLVKTGETINVFDFDGTWYKVTFNEGNTGYASVETLTDTSALKAYYGEVSVSFDAAYKDLTPVAGNAFDTGIDDNSYVADTTVIKVQYAPVNATPENVHKVTFGAVKDATGEKEIAADGTSGNDTIFMNQIEGEASVLAGTQFAFSLSNLLKADWDIKDIDFAKSYVALNHTKGTETTVIDTKSLETAINQTYMLPADMEYETGMYSITVCVYQKGASEAAEYQSLNIVLDATKVENAGLWEFRIRSYYYWRDHDVIHKGDTAPLESVGLALGDLKEIDRDNVFAYYTAGATNVSICLQCDEPVETYDSVTVGEVVGFRMWNSLSGITEEKLAQDNFEKTNSDEAGKAELFYYMGIELYDKETIAETGFLEGGQDIGVVSGVNTIYYQVKLANGTVSEIKSFTIMVTDILPSMDISVEGYVESMNESDIEGQIAVSSLTMKLNTAYSMNGSGDVNVLLYRYGGEKTPVQLGESVTLDKNEDNSYSGVYEPESGFTNRTHTEFVVYDEFGGAMAICPQLGSERRVGNESYYNVNYIQYHYAGEVNNNIEYNIPVMSEDGETILYYETRNTTTGEVLAINYNDLEYNKFAIDDTEYTIAPFNATGSYTDTYKDGNGNTVVNSTFTEARLYVKEDSKVKCLPELVDYDSITFTFYNDTGDYLTVPMVDNYAEPNEVGYMGARRNPYTGEITLYFANYVDEEPAPDSVSYKVNYKDVYGNEYVKPAAYYPNNVSGGVISEELTEKGIELNIGAAVAGGLDAQYIGSGGSTSRGLIQTGVFANGIYHVSYTDMFGKVHEYEYEITEGWDFGVKAEVSTTEPTFGKVSVSLTSDEGLPITVQEAEGIQVTSNNTSAVMVTASKNTTFAFTVENSTDVHEITIDNIVEFKPEIQWSYDESQILTDEKGVKYINGPVSAYIIDAELDVLDSYTGLAPSYTFYPGEDTAYTFKGSDYYAVLGEETKEGTDLTVTLEVELRNESFEVENPELPTGDSNAPAIQLRAYAQRNGLFQNEALALQVEPGIYRTVLEDYDGDEILESFDASTDATELLDKIGWASVYRFQIDLVDDSDVKLFVKRGLYTSAPDYVAGGSDTIDGVSLNGRVLEITENTKFTLYAVDEEGNATSILFDVANVGDAPVPQVKKVYAGTNAYVYILPPDVSDDAVITDFAWNAPDGFDVEKETDENSEYKGQYYIQYTQNGTYLINYSFTYKKNQNVSGEHVVGQLEIVVDEIDDIQILNELIEWSENRKMEATRQDVTVQLTYNKNVKAVKVPDGYEDAVDVLITGNRVTVRYSENMDESLPLTAVANNDTEITLHLDAVTNIDKVAPVVSTPDIELAENGKSVTVTFVTDEDAIFREENSYGTKAENGYVHTTKIKENGTFTYHFVDKAGNIKQVSFTIDSIVDTALELQFNTSASDTGAVKDPSNIKLNVNDSIYVKANRDCKVSLNGGEEKAVTAGTWTELVISDNEAGLWPVVYAEDAYGNTASALLSGVKPLDKEAPVITIKKEQVIAKVGTDRAVIQNMLEENITVNDVDADVNVTIQFTENLSAEGVTSVTYTATDSSNNTSTKTALLKLTSAGEPEVTVNGEVVGRDSIYLGSLADDLNLAVDTDGEPYSIVYKKGVFTTAQMKIGATTLVRDAESVTNTNLPFEEAGYYTICIRTQSHDEYLFIVYVE